MDIRKSVLFAESWNIAYRKGNPGKILLDLETPFNIIENSFRYWAADPFIYERNGDVYIFAELYDYVLCRGVIGYCKLDSSKRIKWTPIIVEKHHLSYPCIMEYGEKIYLMPESSEIKQLVLYEAIDFPIKWEKKYVIRTGEAFVDTTPIKWGKCNFAITYDKKDSKKPQLTLIDLEGLQEDVYVEFIHTFQCRPAGHTFYHETGYIRPAQLSFDSDAGYGKAVLFYSYSLDKDMQYNETLIKEIYPTDLKYSRNFLIDGMHTYNASENYEIIDIKTRRFNVLNFVFRLINKVKRQLKRRESYD